jgi:folate-binding Fe-S cluster repair protein YgfZ
MPPNRGKFRGRMYIVTLQGKIASTGTPQQLTANPLQVGTLVLAAKSGNTASLVVVNSSSASSASDGTGVGYILAAGTSVTFNGPLNTNEIYISGTANDVYSAIGT